MILWIATVAYRDRPLHAPTVGALMSEVDRCHLSSDAAIDSI
jgi:hypothetical protein